MTQPERAHLFISANTHPGMKGKNNEDRFAAISQRFGPRKNIPSVLAMICDGIGGHRAGEVAAEIAVNTICQIVSKSDADKPLEILSSAISQAGAAVSAQAEADPDRKGMGSTCVCAWVLGNRLYTAYVGDSRLYLIRGDRIQQLTTDHTWVQEAIEYGALTPEQARGHPNAHVIRRHLGSKSPVEVDFRLRLQPEETNEQALANQGTPVLPGDRLVLCSDGLTDLVEKEEIFTALNTYDRDTALKNLTDLANQRGGHDNITMVVLEAPADLGAAGAPTARPAKAGPNVRKLVLPCLAVSLLLGIILVSALGIYWYLSRAEPTATQIPSPSASLTSLPGLPDLQATQTPTTEPQPPTETVFPAQFTATLEDQGPAEATYTPWPTSTQLPEQPTLTGTP